MPKGSREAERERQAIGRGDWKSLGFSGREQPEKLLRRFEPNRTLSALQFAATELIAMIAATGRRDISISDRTHRTVSALVEQRACDTFAPPRVSDRDVRSAFRELSRIGRELNVMEDEEVGSRFEFT